MLVKFTEIYKYFSKVDRLSIPILYDNCIECDVFMDKLKSTISFPGHM